MNGSIEADILIAGGGVAGLAAAIALSGHGLQIVVVERRARVGGIHRGDSLMPKSTALLGQWGLRAAIDAAGARTIDRMEIHAPGSRRVYQSAITPANAPNPYLVLPHARLEAVLMERVLTLPNIHVIRPARVVKVLRDRKSARVCGLGLRIGADLQDVSCRLVIAADGQHSVVRRCVGIPCESFSYDHAYLGLEAERPSAYRDAMRLHFHTDGGVLLMPHPDHIGVGVLVEAGSAKYWLTMDESTLSAELTRRAPILQGMGLNVRGAHVYELSRGHAECYVKDGVVLIGDAAHCTNPTAGQGMAMALSDAGALAEAIVPDGVKDIHLLDGALARYQTRQWKSNQRLVRYSHWLARAYSLRGPTWTVVKLLAVMAVARPSMRGITAPLVARFTSQ
jgi:2-polyprenyl-6-methoxyphenol hydroxylase-like FAD-dependent oxidoreductase